jgi:hypothetical protein
MILFVVDVGESLMMYGLYRVKSCPDIVDQMNNDLDGLLPKNIHLELELNKTNGESSSQQTLVLLRVASRSRRDSQTQRYSCGALDGKVLVTSNNNKIKDSSSNPSPSPSGCGSRHNSNTSLNCNSFSVIEVS